ncbi:MAG: hypothetical protein GY696_00265 [Gammaproteobacteria bacterium]|nr:hypothetical protein [Gammaproteobacteria bacterium]
MDNTEVDFWRMVWQENSAVIVNLVSPLEMCVHVSVSFADLSLFSVR